MTTSRCWKSKPEESNVESNYNLRFVIYSSHKQPDLLHFNQELKTQLKNCMNFSYVTTGVKYFVDFPFMILCLFFKNKCPSKWWMFEKIVERCIVWLA